MDRERESFVYVCVYGDGGVCRYDMWIWLEEFLLLSLFVFRPLCWSQVMPTKAHGRDHHMIFDHQKIHEWFHPYKKKYNRSPTACLLKRQSVWVNPFEHDTWTKSRDPITFVIQSQSQSHSYTNTHTPIEQWDSRSPSRILVSLYWRQHTLLRHSLLLFSLLCFVLLITFLVCGSALFARGKTKFDCWCCWLFFAVVVFAAVGRWSSERRKTRSTPWKL